MLLRQTPAADRPARAAVPEVPAAPTPASDQNEVQASRPLWTYGILLGLLTALGAFGIDTYLPAFPQLAAHFGVEEGRIQLSLTSYFLALALGQVFYGPISDRVGRRGPLIVGFLLYSAASLASVFAPSIGVLIGLRFVQGIGACAGMVIARAVVRDLAKGEKAAKLFALMILVLGVSPILAPLLGSLLIAFFPWHSIFWAMGAMGLGAVAMVALFLPETLPSDRRGEAGLAPAFKTYGRLLRDRTYVGTALIGGLSQGAVFAYLAGSPFVFIELHGVSPTVYALLFALNASALIGAAQFNVMLFRRFGATRLVRSAAALQTLAALGLLTIAWLGADTVPLIACLLFVTLGCHGILGPTTSLLAIEPWPENAGSASALMGSLQFACGAVASALVSLLADGTTVPMAASITLCAAAGLALAWATLRRRNV